MLINWLTLSDLAAKVSHSNGITKYNAGLVSMESTVYPSLNWNLEIMIDHDK